MARYYHELQAGLLEPRRVDTRAWEALRELFDTDVRALTRPRPAPVQAAPAFRLSTASSSAEFIPQARAAEEDEVDRLLRSGP